MRLTLAAAHIPHDNWHDDIASVTMNDDSAASIVRGFLLTLFNGDGRLSLIRNTVTVFLDANDYRILKDLILRYCTWWAKKLSRFKSRCRCNRSRYNETNFTRNSRDILVTSVSFYLERLHRYRDSNFAQLLAHHSFYFVV